MIFARNKLVNKTFNPLEVELKVNYPNAKIRWVGREGAFKIPEEGNMEGIFFIDIPADKLKGMKTKIEIEILSPKDGSIEVVKTTFLAPAY